MPPKLTRCTFRRNCDAYVQVFRMCWIIIIPQANEVSCKKKKRKQGHCVPRSNVEKDEVAWELLPLMLPLFLPCVIISLFHLSLLTAVNIAVSILIEGTSVSCLSQNYSSGPLSIFPCFHRCCCSDVAPLFPLFSVCDLDFYLSITACVCILHWH